MNTGFNRDLAAKAYSDLVSWQQSQLTGKPVKLEHGLDAICRLYQYGDIPSLAPILGQLLWLKGKPFSIENYFPFEPLYKRFDRPRKKILKCGRQVAKSTSLAVEGIITSATIPNHQTLYVCPLFEQIRRFSSNYVRPFINDSPIKPVLIGETLNVTQNVLQRTFRNGSIMHFTFASTSVDRARGLSCDELKVDEAQDINVDFLPVLEYCTAASSVRGTSLSGTPKTLDNLIEVEWQRSSQAEWVIKCGCGYWNVCNIAHDLDKMIQRDGLCCAKCGGFLNPRTGNYVHQINDPDIIRDYPGYHIPQPILPLHLPYGICGGSSADNGANNWRLIWRAKNSGNQTAYLNECLGESCDQANKMVTLTELMALSQLPWSNIEDKAFENIGEYSQIVMGIDWGGGAGGIVRRSRGVLVVEGGTASFTVIAIVGFKGYDTTPHLLYAERLPVNITPQQEVARALYLYKKFQCYRIAHDFGGAGNLRESMLIQAGFPADRIFPCMYVPAMGGKPLVKWVSPNVNNPRSFYEVDKARSLSMLCQLLKLYAGRNPATPVFPRFIKEDINLPEDFLALVEDKRDRPSGADLLLVTRHPSKPDDFCHAFNFACLSHWHSQQHYPDLAQLFEIGLTEQEQAALYPSLHELNWDMDS